MKRRFVKKISAYVAVVCMLVSMLPVTVLANPETETENTETVVENTDDIKVDVPVDAILLSTPEDVVALAEECRINSWSVGKTVALTKDIDMTGVEFEGIPTFGGTFLGQGYTIKGLNLTQEGSNVGFFRYVQNGAVVHALSIQGIIQPQGSKSAVGAIAGNNAGTIYKCNANVLLSGYEQIGGIVGVNVAGGLVLDCNVDGVVYGNHFVGGIVGENHGVVRGCTNNAEVNTQSVQHSVSIEDITMDSMINTESAYTTTDIGGIAGISSGVIRTCWNKGAIGYQSMGYNVGGIVGTQNGYVVGCVNFADVQGRKEVGGIVGHMEPNIVVSFSEDTLQQLSDQMAGLDSSVDSIKNSIDRSDDDITSQIEGLENDAENVQSAINALQKATTPEEFHDELEDLQNFDPEEFDPEEDLNFDEDLDLDFDSDLDFDEDMDLDINWDELNPDDLIPDLDNDSDTDLDLDLDSELDMDLENEWNSWEEEFKNELEELEKESSLYEDRVTAATNDLSDALDNFYAESEKIQESTETYTKEMENKVDGLLSQLDAMQATINNMDEGIKVEWADVSGADTEEDMIGKIDNCINLGNVTGDINIGGIAGIMAEENDLDEYEDTSIYGDTSLNVSSEIRVVVRNCRNYGTISAGKQYAGGIAGYMMMGAVLYSVNLGNMDALNADYVGGIAGCSDAVIRGSSCKAILAGDSYVGGIAGAGHEVQDCFAFVSVAAYTEKAGAILGYTSDLPDGEKDTVNNNYYYVSGENVGGIDSIGYTGATNEMDMASFLQIPYLNEAMRVVNVRFQVEGQEDIVLTVAVGESLGLDKLPVLEVEDGSEYDWKYIPSVTSEVLAMGETETVEYVSEELLSNLLFNQTYEAVFDKKNTVISSTQRNEKNLSVLLAEGSFAKHTTLELTDALKTETNIAGDDLIVNWNVKISNPGVSKLHYLIPEGTDADNYTLYVKDVSGTWVERDYIVDGTYIIFDFADGETAFAISQNAGASAIIVVLVVVAVFIVGVSVGKIATKKRNKKLEKKEA